MRLKLVVMASALAMVAGCSGGIGAPPRPKAQRVRHRPAAAAPRSTVPARRSRTRLYSKWFSEYHKLHPNVAINYQSLGSGAGIRQLTSRTVFFGASDQPMKDEQLQAAPGKILHFPTVLGAVVPVYNLPEVSEPLKFTGPLIADIVLGKVKKWNDPAIVKLNAGVKLPSTDITFVHRSEGSGTTFIFADYLGKISPEFKSKVGVGLVAQVADRCRRQGQRGRVGHGHADAGLARLRRARLRAAEQDLGRVRCRTAPAPSSSRPVSSVTAAAAGAAANMPPDFRVSITNAPGADAYPIASFTWLLLYEDPAGQGPGGGPCATSCAGRSPTARSWRRSWATPACRPRSSTWSSRRSSS